MCGRVLSEVGGGVRFFFFVSVVFFFFFLWRCILHPFVGRQIAYGRFCFLYHLGGHILSTAGRLYLTGTSLPHLFDALCMYDQFQLD